MERSWKLESLTDAAPATHGLSFSDHIAHEREDLVEAAVVYLNGIVGLEAVHVDREWVELAAPAMTTDELQLLFADWWKAAIKRKAAWQAEMDLLASALHETLKPLGFRKSKWAFNRTFDDEVIHVIELKHHSSEDGHRYVLASAVHLPATDPIVWSIAPQIKGVGEDMAFLRGFAMPGGALPANVEQATFDLHNAILPHLDPLTTARSTLPLLENGQVRGQHHNSWFTAAIVHSVLGKAEQAQVSFQRSFDEGLPQAREHLLRIAEKQGHVLQTGTVRTLSMEDDEVLTLWRDTYEERATAFVASCGLKASRWFGDASISRKTLEQLSQILTDDPKRLLVSAEGGQLLRARYFGLRQSQSADHMRLAQALSAVFGVLAQSANAEWGVGGNGGLVLRRKRDWPVLERLVDLLDAPHQGGWPNTLVAMYEQFEHQAG